MTVKEFVLNQKPMGINGWLNLIEASGLVEHEKLIISCAEYFDLIVLNHDANFIDCIN
jgi:hypothetical protein